MHLPAVLDNPALHQVLAAVITFLGVYVLLTTTDRVLTAQRRRQLAASRGCEPVRLRPSKDRFGIAMSREILQSDKEHRLPTFIHEVFGEMGAWTWGYKSVRRTATITADPILIHVLLSKQFDDFIVGMYRNAAWYPLQGDNVFTLDGSPWKHHRALLKPQFNKEMVADLENLEKHMKRFLGRLFEGGQTTREVNILILFYRLTLDSASEFLFGGSLDTQLKEVQENQEMDFEEAFRISQEGIALRAVIGPSKARLVMDNKKFLKACKLCRGLVSKYVDQAVDCVGKVNGDRGKKYVLLEEMVKDTQDKKILRDEAMGLLVAGRDTTAVTLGWAMRCFAKHPEVYQKLRKEVIDELGEGSEAKVPNYAQVKGFTYLHWVILEVLRLYPPVPINGRSAKRDTVLPLGGGENGDKPFLVKKGQGVQYSIFTLHRRKDIYGPDAEEFRPERWGEAINGQRLRSTGFTYMPFSGGPRICIGQQLAMINAGYILARIAQTVATVKPCTINADKQVAVDKYYVTVTMSPADGAWVEVAKA